MCEKLYAFKNFFVIELEKNRITCISILLAGLFFYSICIQLKNAAVLDLASIGVFLGGCVALLTFLLAPDVLNNFLERQRVMAAKLVISSFESCIYCICEIIKTPALYQYKKYYPGSFPETGDKNAERFPERPIRLVTNYLGNLKKRLVQEPLSHLTGSEFIQIQQSLDDLDKICRTIVGWLTATLGDHPEGLKIACTLYESPQAYEKELVKILSDVKMALIPLIRAHSK